MFSELPKSMEHPGAHYRTRLQDRYIMNARSGWAIQNANEEKQLADFLIGCASIGYAKSCKDVLSIVQQILYS